MTPPQTPDDLKPCPWCEGNALWFTSSDMFNSNMDGLVGCSTVGCVMDVGGKRIMTATAWNTRAGENIDQQRLGHYKRENAALRAENEIYKSAHKDELQ